MLDVKTEKERIEEVDKKFQVIKKENDKLSNSRKAIVLEKQKSKLREREERLDGRLSEIKLLIKLFPEHKEITDLVDIVFGRVLEYKKVKENLSLEAKLHYHSVNIENAFKGVFRFINTIPSIVLITKILGKLNTFEKRLKTLEKRRKKVE